MEEASAWDGRGGSVHDPLCLQAPSLRRQVLAGPFELSLAPCLSNGQEAATHLLFHLKSRTRIVFLLPSPPAKAIPDTRAVIRPFTGSWARSGQVWLAEPLSPPWLPVWPEHPVVRKPLGEGRGWLCPEAGCDADTLHMERWSSPSPHTTLSPMEGPGVRRASLCSRGPPALCVQGASRSACEVRDGAVSRGSRQ